MHGDPLLRGGAAAGRPEANVSGRPASAAAAAPGPPPAWRPLLTGALAERAREAIDDVAVALAAIRSGAVDPHRDPYPRRVLGLPSLGTGSSGPALFFAYFDAARPGGGACGEAVGYLELAIEQLGRQPMQPILYDGFFGVAWVAEHLTRRGLLGDRDDDGGDRDAEAGADGDLNDEIDELLAGVLEPGFAGDYDLIRGLVGLGVYACERLPAEAGRRGLERVVSQLAARAERRPPGLAWWTPAELALPVGFRPSPHGHINVGVAHGVSGVVGFLGQLLAAGLERQRAAPLLAGAVEWLLAQGTGDPTVSIFPGAILPHVESQPTRTAWCYGDAGIAVVLLLAARAAGRRDWERQARAIAHAVIDRRLERMAVIDGGLCHGFAGLGHLFNRLWQATGEPAFRDAAVGWFERALDFRRPGEGFAGFRAWARIQEQEVWRDDPGFLIGATGIGLALLAATTAIEPEWDRVMLMSVPPRGESGDR